MRHRFAVPALFATALIVPLLAASPAPAQTGHGHIIASGPDAVTAKTSATFTFNDWYLGDQVAGRSCTLDNVPIDCRANPWTTPTLDVGPHHLMVTAVEFTNPPPLCDPTGCTQLPPTSTPVDDHWDWTVVAPPTASLTAPAKPFQLGSSATLSWRTTIATQAPPVSGVQLSSRRAGANGTFGTPTTRTVAAPATRATANLKPGDTDCFRVRATDASGTIGPWSPERCVSLPLDDRAMTASKGWKRTKSSSAYNSTLTTARSARRTLSGAIVRVARVGVVATTCRSCGKVTVKIGTKTIGTINLRSATTRHRQLLLLPAFAPRSGKLTLTTTSTQMVQIDGLALSAK